MREPIAIVGSACHFAGGASTPSKLWDILQNPQDLTTEVPDARFSARGFYHKHHAHPGHSDVRRSYLLSEDVRAFDSEFFGIKSVEAKAMDPQQRLLLETVFEGLESAGLTIQSLRGTNTSMYAGVMCSDYESMLLRDLQATPTYFATGTATSMLANRVSHFFDWRGASISIDTACSSSLVAVHLAVQALREGQSRVAVASGANLILGPENYIIESKLKMLSPDGMCKMWDRDANGYARGEGIACVILKTLSSALEDGDHIECIIRETGLNQDGATPGITIPSSSAQENLIRETYIKAGLDLEKSEDRPQYFEAHGTGTPAGDPREAEAIHRTFFGSQDASKYAQPAGARNPLFVGSIKTVFGHTEGTAGLAGILKASLALQNSSIPPNLHFHHLSERVAPFYDHLEIVRDSPRAWPTGPEAALQCRRASVNSFGFGGANAHCILESFEGDSTKNVAMLPLQLTFTPFLFSAASESSLRANLAAFASYLKCSTSQSVHDLAWTLRKRRSLFAYRAHFTASSLADLERQLSSALQDEKSAIGIRVNARSSVTSSIASGTKLGIFTGQGAQFARLGAELVEQSPTARHIIQRLEADLAALSPQDRPPWSLMDEILASTDSSRVGEAAIAQPLCTAIQILLVDLLALAGVHFDVVVGHSSGEIGAAYAAGVLSSRDAICVAYLRGVYVGQAVSPNGQHIRGAMMAVGMSFEDAEELCHDEVYDGRLTVAACNSSSSVTISGDEAAIEELQDLLEDEERFFRRLRVDTAYHSRHMDACFAPYVEALQRCGVQAQTSRTQRGPRPCKWISSVYNREMGSGETIAMNDKYWAENMTKPVLFHQALSTALSPTDATAFSVALEVGPHPALQGPASQTIQELLEKAIPYSSTLVRKTDAVTAMSKCLGFLWQHLESDQPQSKALDLDRYERSMQVDDVADRTHVFKVVKGLPSYQWNHTSQYWSESRTSRRLRLRQDHYNPLLGHRTPDSSNHHLRWRNYLRADEGDGIGALGLNCHRVQGQAVFPAAGYIATALEAARVLPATANALTGSPLAKAIPKNIHLVEIRNFKIHQAVTLASEKNADDVEVLIELADIAEAPASDRITARFLYCAALESNGDSLTLAASAEVEVLVGETDPDPNLLPPRLPVLPHMVKVSKDRFYSVLADVGYEYSGRFQAMEEQWRKHGKSSCLVKMERRKSQTAQRDEQTNDGNTLLFQPSELDSAFQSLLLAYSYPGDNQLDALHLPLSIGCIRVNPALCGSAVEQMRRMQGDVADGDVLAPVDAVVRDQSHNQNSRSSLSSPEGGFSGDIKIFTDVSCCAAVQIYDARLVPVAGSAKQDRKIFTTTEWVDMMPDGHAAAGSDHDAVVSPQGYATIALLERIAVYYLRQFDQQVPADSSLRSLGEGGATAHYLEYAQHVLTSLPPSFPVDSLEDLHKAAEVCPDLVDVKLMHLIGDTMPRVFRGETTMLERFRETAVLDEYYVHGFSPAPSGRWQSSVVQQLVRCNPHLKMLEIGAGTGGTTKPILHAIGNRFQSYTFTDISAGFFGAAAEEFSCFQDRINFKTLDVEKDPVSQGFSEGVYDVIIASFVLHATASLARTLANARKLLRPGGFLVVGEGSLNTPASSFIFGPLDGWWLGRADGRIWSPHASTAQWDHLLRENGFSGIDTKAPSEWEDVLGVCLFVSQAVDDQVMFLRSPLSYTESPRRYMVDRLVLIGGETTFVANLAQDILTGVKPFARQTCLYSSLLDIDFDGLTVEELARTAFLSLTDLDRPIFKDMTEAIWNAFQRLLQDGKKLLWVTSGRRAEEPFSNMVVGFCRTAVHETQGLSIQHLDVADRARQSLASDISETLLRFVQRSDTSNEAENSHILWTNEPEIIIDSDGRHRAARLEPLVVSNERYNSGRRTVFREEDMKTAAVALQRDHKDVIKFEMMMPVEAQDGMGHCLELRTLYSTALALKLGSEHSFLVLGADSTSGAQNLAIVPSLASVMKVHPTRTLPCSFNGTTAADLLSLAVSFLTADAITAPLSPGSTILVHNATDSLAHAIRIQSAARELSAIFITDAGCSASPALNAIAVPSYVSQSELWAMLPARKSVASFVSFTSRDSHSPNRDMILAELPAWCCKETLDTLYSPTGFANVATADDILMKTMQQALEHAREHIHTPQSLLKAVTVDELTKFEANGVTDKTDSHAALENPHNKMFILDLATHTKVPVQVKRLDAGRSMFASNRTYWLVGLSGALGISLCDWMISAGARHLVLSSRNPQIETDWVQSHLRSGAHIMIMPCDITNYDALATVCESIRREQPPIGGVLNGAMVLRDTSIRNMTFAQLNDVIRPKVIGSLHLDRLFGSEQNQLDFFVLLSSINCVIGNQGQANYAAANTFLGALAASRRRRGLPGVSLNVGAIIGAGYIQRSSTRVLDLTVSRGAMMHLSEEDFHQLVAEAVATSLPSSSDHPCVESAEISTGLLDVAFDATERPIWFSDPKFKNLIVAKGENQDVVQANGSTSSHANTPKAIQERLRLAQTRQDVECVVMESFAATLRHELQMKDVKDQELMEMSGPDIGLDSLVAVDIRNWFLKTLSVSIPVLRILGKGTMATLVRQALESLPQDMTPGLATVLPIPQSQTAVTNPEELSDGTLNTANNASLAPKIAKEANDGRDMIDWEAETSPPETDDDFDSQLRSVPGYASEPVFPPRVLVLTGTSGLLGHHLVEHFLQLDFAPAKIICVASRQHASRNLRQQGLPLATEHNNTSVVTYAGDLSSPCLGLTQSECASIFATADAVIHVGAETSHLKPYETLRAANVGSTSELARFCLPRKIPLHFISSAGVGLFLGAEQPELLPMPVLKSPPAAAAALSGYTASKWACERLLHRVNEKYGLPVWIHRPSTIIREGADAQGERALLDWMNGLVTYIKKLGAVPEVKHIKGALDMVYVESVCETVARAVLGLLHGSEEGDVSYVHEVGDIVVPLDRMHDLLHLDMHCEASRNGHVNGNATNGGNGHVESFASNGSNGHVKSFAINGTNGHVRDLTNGFINEKQPEKDEVMNSLAKSEAELTYQTMPMAEWTARAVVEGLHPAVAALIEEMDGPDKPNYPRLRRTSLNS